MAVSPVILNKLPFDAELDLKIQFTYNGPQVFAYRVIVQDNLSNSTIYDVKSAGQSGTTQDMYAIVPANVLTNGYNYNFQISVFDYEDNESPLSSVKVLKALKTPIFFIKDAVNAMSISTSYYDATIVYSQENNELLNTYSVNLYSSDKVKIWSSGTKKYDDLYVRVSGLTDNTTYYIQAFGETVNGIQLSTDMISFTCDYIKQDIFLSFDAENIYDEGIVRLTSHFVSLEGRSNTDSLIYVDDEKISLLNGEQVYFDQGYSVGNFTCRIVVSNIPDYSRIITFDVNNTLCTIDWNKGLFIGYDDDVYYAELVAHQTVGDEDFNYIMRSNKIFAPEEDQQIFIWIQNIDGAFNLAVEYVPVGTIISLD